MASVLWAASVSKSGHVAGMAGVWPLLRTLHVLAISAWVGELLPLWQGCYRLAPARLLALMQQFGRVAVIVVLVLISCGVLILLQLLDSPAALFVTDYGRLMLLKLMLVAAMLLLAAWHKFNLVKALAKHQNSRLLARSIFIEMLLALLVLVTCSSFTTVVGLAR